MSVGRSVSIQTEPDQARVAQIGTKNRTTSRAQEEPECALTLWWSTRPIQSWWAPQSRTRCDTWISVRQITWRPTKSVSGETRTTGGLRNRWLIPSHMSVMNVLHILTITKNLSHSPCQAEGETDECLAHFDKYQELGVGRIDYRPRNAHSVHPPRLLHWRWRTNHCTRGMKREDVHPRHKWRQHRNVCQRTKSRIRYRLME